MSIAWHGLACLVWYGMVRYDDACGFGLMKARSDVMIFPRFIDTYLPFLTDY
jgi:hypothetical protein